MNFAAAPDLWAAAPKSGTSCPCWQITETANFRLLNYGTQPASPSTGANCEALRAQLVRQWGGESSLNWRPRCDLVLHATDDAYLREVGPGGRSTLASSLVERAHGCIAKRRIDVRASKPDGATSALAHELTHVVLADHFPRQALPRWVDEGVAVLADPAAKQARHRADLAQALARGGEFRAIELMHLSDYPAAHRWGTFYGQSASLVHFLIQQSGHQRFLKFVEGALERGYEQSLRSEYNCSLAELESRWRNHVRNEPFRPVSYGR